MPSSPTTGSSKLGLVNSGDSLRSVARADRMTALQDMSRAQHMGEPFSPGANLQRMVGPGWVIHRQRKGRFRGRPRSITPWQISVSGNSSSGLYIHVRPGTINGILPTNMFDPLGPISGQGTIYVTLQALTDGIQLTNCYLIVSTDPPNPAPWLVNLAPYQFQIMIGVTVDRAPFNVVDGLLWAQPTVMLQTLSQSLAPGRPYYDNNYSWVVTQY